jgi:hypothetical protein
MIVARAAMSERAISCWHTVCAAAISSCAALMSAAYADSEMLPREDWKSLLVRMDRGPDQGDRSLAWLWHGASYMFYEREDNDLRLELGVGKTWWRTVWGM